MARSTMPLNQAAAKPRTAGHALTENETALGALASEIAFAGSIPADPPKFARNGASNAVSFVTTRRPIGNYIPNYANTCLHSRTALRGFAHPLASSKQTQFG